MLLLALLLSPLDGERHARAFFVPPFWGAFTLDVGLDGRFDGVVQETDHNLPEQSLRVGAGYLYYLDGHGTWSLGPYLSSGLAFGDEARAPTASVDLGLRLRRRSLNATYQFISLGAWVEGGSMVVGQPGPCSSDPQCTPSPSSRGWRVAAGLETGPGLLLFLDPYIFGELVARVGVETVYLDGRVTALTAGLRMAFDFGLRGR